MTSILVITLSVINVVFATLRINRYGLHISSLYWIVIGYIAIIPVLIDSFALFVNKGEVWSRLLSSIDENLPYNLHYEVLLRFLCFMTVFNMIVFIFKSEQLSIPVIDYGDLFFCKMAMVSGWAVLPIVLIQVLYGGVPGLFFNLSVCILTISASSVIISIQFKKQHISIFGMLPSIIAGFIAAQRPYLVPVVACIVYGSQLVRYKFKPFHLFVIGLLSVAIMQTGLQNRPGIDYTLTDIFKTILYPVVRDSSTCHMYMSFDYPLTSYNGTNLNGVRALLLTPMQIASDDDLLLGDVPAYLARIIYGWQHGTIHPSLFGWAYTDMRWYGLLFAFFLVFIFYIGNMLSQRSVSHYAVSVACISQFIFVGGRGSVQVGFTRMFYSLIIGILLCMICRRWHNKYYMKKNKR